MDVLTRGCDVWIDDEQVIAKGQCLPIACSLACLIADWRLPMGE